MSKDKYFNSVSPQVNFAELEDNINKYWKQNKTFEKSVENRPKARNWTFLDGPPFVTGMPHYGHLLGSIHKDLFGRYQTMRGYRVRRVWGWDGHGLPIENKVENKLGIKRKRDIEEKVGVDVFIAECKKYVEQISGEWEWYIDHIGRWVDFKNAYKTWDTPYMESVMWVFKQMYEKGHIYKGLRVSLFCPHCSTPISNFEVAMDPDNYQEITEPANTYKYKVVGQEKTFLLAWSTTPWNKIVTPALAINPKLTYVKVKQGDEYYILAEDRTEILLPEPKWKVVEKLKGQELVGFSYEPHYDFYTIEKGKKAFVVIPGDFVSSEEGTGIVTIAAYGEDDLKAMQEHNIQIVLHLDEEGHLVPSVPNWAGMYYAGVNPLVNEDLTRRGLMYKEESYKHTVPTCWRCHTRLYYAPLDAWFVNVQDLKPLMKKTNEKVNWFPKHFKIGRFLKSLENAPDWNISRNRYWGSPVPVWECECGERFVPGSIRELEEASVRKITDLHKPGIDEVTIKCVRCGGKVKRVPEVLDSWIEAGSASFAERHYPFNQTEKLDDFFPPDFIAEYTGQIRAWFYVLHVIGAALYKSHAFKNVGVEGVILGSDGKKMSKNLGNYPDPKEMLTKYGGDGLRLYLMGSPVMKGEDLIISEEQYRNKVRSTLLILWNVYNFFVYYANLDNWSPNKAIFHPSNNVLDKWILTLLSNLIKQTTDALGEYDTVKAVGAVEEFVNHFSLWYIRRSRDRVGPAADEMEDKNSFYQTTYLVLTSFCKVSAPIIPFVTEEIYMNLTKEASVHLSDWPDFVHEPDEALLSSMEYARVIVEKIHALRKQKNIPVRQPLAEVILKSPQPKLPNEIIRVLLDEVNIKSLSWGKANSLSVKLNTKITPELEEEAKTRELMRKIQEERKNMGVSLESKVIVHTNWRPTSPQLLERLRRKTLSKEILPGDFKVTKA